MQIANEQETWGTKIDPTRSRAGSFEKTQVEWGKAQDTVNEFTKNYKGLERVKFRVTRTSSDIEDRTGFSEQDKAVYDPADQTIYIFSDKHLDEADVLRTLQHETIGHFGLSKLLDEKDLDVLVKKVKASRLQSEQFKKIYDDVAKRYKGREESVIAEEVIARIAETTNFDSRFERIRDQIFELIAKALRSIGLTNGKISQAEIRNILRESEALIKNKIALPGDEISRLTRAEAMGFATGTTVYHGSVGTFDQFDPYRTNPSGHFGKGFYFSDSEYDVDINYAGTSGETIANEIDDIKEFAESNEEQRLNMKKRFGVEEEGQIRSTVIPAYLKMKNPFDLTKGNTWFEFEYEYDEEGDIIPDTESGTGMDLFEAIQTVSYEYNVDSNKLLSELEIWDGIEANELVKRLMMADEVMYVEDFASELSSGEFIRRVIEELGYDGIVMNASEAFPGMNMPKSTRHYIVFKPTQIRRTDAKFDPLEEASPLIYARKEEDDGDNAYNLKDERLLQYHIRKFQDTFHRVKMLESEVAKARGKERIESKESTYVGEALYYGKVETAIEKLNGEFLRPIGRKLSEYKISMEELDLYLYAKHAQERNEHIAEINEDMPDGGSGMTNEEADTVLEKAEEEGKVEQLEELANEVYKITSGTRDLLRDTGLIEEDLLNAWQEAYEFYVPLKGAASDQSQYGSGTGKGFSVSGKESLRAMGRQSKAHSPFAQVYADRVEKIIRSEKNALGVKFYNFVQDNPNSDLFAIWTEDNAPPSRTIQERVDPETKEKSQEVVTVNSLYQAKQETVVVREDPYRFNNTKVPEGFARMWTIEKTIPKYFSVKIPVTKEDEAGANQTTTEEVLIEIKDPLLNLAMHRAGMDEMSKIASFLLRYNRLLSAVNTQFNPVFVPTNFIRDVQTAVAALEGEKTREGGLLRGEQTEQLTQNILKGLQSRVKNYYKFTRAQLRDKKLKNLTQEQIEEQRWFNEYLEDGAKTAFFYTRTIEEVQADVNKIIADQTSQPTLSKRVTGGAVAFGRIVEDLNTAVENGVRFSTYIEARKAGVDRETAAFIAKTLTVNFNKKGDWGNDLNSFYLFYNAAMQGVANVARFGEALIMKPSLNKLANGQSLNNAQKLASGTVALAAIAAFGNEWLSEDDEDGESFYSKISDYEKERNFIFMNPYNGEDYVKFPLPYGYNTFHNLGTAMAETSMGIKEPTEAAWFWGVGFVNSFNPVGGSIMPTIVQPHWEISQNENWRGAPIYKEDMFGQNIPDSSKAMGRLPEAASRSWMINWAKWMNRTSGGTENITGGVDISPDTIEHLIDFHMGGAGRFVTNIIDTSADIAKGKRVERQGIPGARRLYGEPNPQENAKRYFENITELDQLYNEYESLAEKDWKKAEEFRLKNRQVDLAEDVKDWKEDLSEYREMIRYIKNSENYSQQEKNVKIKDYEEKMNSLYMQFNYHYNSYEALSK